MNPFLNMEQHKADFTPNELKIYEAISAHPDQVTYQPTNKLAELLGVSQPALTRFIKTLGYARYQDFRSDITAYLATQSSPSESDRLPYFEKLQSLLDEAESVLTDSYMREIAEYLLDADSILATGIGKSMQPALLLQSLMRKHGIFVHTCPLDTINEYADQMGANDLLIVFSVSGQSEIMERAKAANGRVMLVTVNRLHKYKKWVDRTVVLPYVAPDPETCPVSPVLFDIFVELTDVYISRLDHTSLPPLTKQPPL